MGIVYRAQQFWLALRPTTRPEDLDSAANYLGAELSSLFDKMQPSEKAHSVKIFQGLLQQGETCSDLLAAALLHDVGKSLHPLRLWERVLIVTARMVLPNQTKTWGYLPDGTPASSGDPPSDGHPPPWETTWRRAFIIAENHPAWGAHMASSAGATNVTVKLIREHQIDDIQLSTNLTQQEKDLLVKLQRMDGSY